jgi:FkbM family methyltransferase
MDGSRLWAALRRAVPPPGMALLRRARNTARRLESHHVSRQGFDARARAGDVVACYRLLLGRKPDERGYRAYALLVRKRHLTIGELTGYFMSSPEFQDRMRRADGPEPRGLARVELQNGMRLYVRSDDPVGAEMSREGAYETHVTEQVLLLLKPGSVFVDVGASIGYFTILAARAVGPEGKVIACEPGPQNHTVLLLNTVVNKVDNVLIVPCAISDAAGVVAYRHLGGGNGAIAGFDGAPESIGTGDLVQARSLDDILEGQPRVDVIKIDVEGAEGRVIAGATETLGRYGPTLLFEFSPPGLQAVSGVSGEDFLRGLAARRYRFRVLGGDDLATMTADEVLERFRRQPGDHIDVMATASR